MKKANIALFLFVTLIPTYFLSGLLLLLANKIRLIEAFKRYYPTLTLDAIWGNYPKIWQSLLISFVVSLLIMLKLFYQPKKSLYGNAEFATKSEVQKTGLSSANLVINCFALSVRNLFHWQRRHGEVKA